MKKILGIILIIFAVLFVSGCTKKTSAIATFFDVEVEQTVIVLSVEITDPDEEITGAITIKLLRTGGTVVNSREVVEEEDLIDITFSALDNSLEYTVEVHATVGRNSVLIGTSAYRLLPAGTIYITTPEQFLNMGTNRSGNYVLDNDLDFSGISFSTIFTSPFSGSFDGQGFTIKNINFTKISTYTGIFGFVSSGRIKNLVLENINIGTVANPLVMTTSSRVGILAGYVSTATAVIENITIKNSVISYSTSSTVMAYVGAVVGELRADMKDIKVDQVDIYLTSTSHARINIGGIVGFLTETALLNRVETNANIHFTMAGEDIKNQNVVINIGGVIGKHSATLNNNAVQDIYSTGNITVDLDFGTAEDTDDAYYAVYVGGLVGIANRNIINAFFAGSIFVNHEANENEAEVSKSIFVGGLVGSYGSNRVTEQTVRINNGQTIELNISEDVDLHASQTFGDNASTVEQNIGLYGERHLNINSISVIDSDESDIYENLDEFFTSDWMEDAYQEFINQA